MYWCRCVVSYTGAGLLCLILVQASCIIYWCRPAVIYWWRPAVSYIGAGILCHILVQACCHILVEGLLSYTGAGLLCLILVQTSCFIYWFRPAVIYLWSPAVLYIGTGLLCHILVQICCAIFWCRPAEPYSGAGLLCHILVQAYCVIYGCRPLRHIFHSQLQKFTKLCAKHCIKKTKYSIRNFSTITLFFYLKFHKTSTNGYKDYLHQHIRTNIARNSHVTVLLSAYITLREVHEFQKIYTIYHFMTPY